MEIMETDQGKTVLSDNINVNSKVENNEVSANLQVLRFEKFNKFFELIKSHKINFFTGLIKI